MLGIAHSNRSVMKAPGESSSSSRLGRAGLSRADCDTLDLPQAEILHSSGGPWTPQWKSHGGAWEFSSAFEMSSATRGLFIGAHGSGGYASPEHNFALQRHGRKWQLGKLDVNA
jgi:hypothetical protein